MLSRAWDRQTRVPPPLKRRCGAGVPGWHGAACIPAHRPYHGRIAWVIVNAGIIVTIPVDASIRPTSWKGQTIMHRRLNPDHIRKNPQYSQGIEAAPGMRFLAIAGQTGQRADGSVPEGMAAQADLAWRNVLAVLAEAGMGPEHILHYTSYLVAGSDTKPYDEARLRNLGTARPASTKIYVSALARPPMLCEVQAFAAAPAVEEPIV